MASWRRILRSSPGELTIHDAIYDVIRRSDIRMSEISNRTGIPYKTLKTWTVEPDNPSGAVRCMPVHQVPPVTNATGNYALLDALEAACGRVAFRTPEIADPTRDLVLEIAAAIREFGELATASGQAIHDGVVTLDELAVIEDDGYQAIQHVLRLMAAARAAAGGPRTENCKLKVEN